MDSAVSSSLFCDEIIKEEFSASWRQLPVVGIVVSYLGLPGVLALVLVMVSWLELFGTMDNVCFLRVSFAKHLMAIWRCLRLLSAKCTKSSRRAVGWDFAFHSLVLFRSLTETWKKRRSDTPHSIHSSVKVTFDEDNMIKSDNILNINIYYNISVYIDTRYDGSF